MRLGQELARAAFEHVGKKATDKALRTAAKMLGVPDENELLARLGSAELTARKVFHVSPFQDVAGEYHFRFALHPDRIAIRSVFGESWTYERFAREAGALAAWLGARGVRAGDRVSLLLYQLSGISKGKCSACATKIKASPHALSLPWPKYTCASCIRLTLKRSISCTLASSATASLALWRKSLMKKSLKKGAQFTMATLINL